MGGIADRVPRRVKQQIVATLPPSVWRRMRPLVLGHSVVHRHARRAGLRLWELQVREKSSSDLRAVEHRGRRYLARTVTEFRSGDVLTHNLLLVSDSLHKHGVDFAVLDAESHRRRVVVVPRPQRAAALAALAQDLRGRPTYLSEVRDRQLVGAVLAGRAQPHRRAHVLRVFEVFASPGGTYLEGPALGCDVEFWEVTDDSWPADTNGEPIPAGSMLAPRRNRWADLIRPEDWVTAQQLVDGVQLPVLATAAQEHLFTVTEPVDAVYTWVDGNDPAWLRRKAETQAAHGDRSALLHATAANASRFQSRDELRYSLRSLDMYAGWIRQIYLVTDDQVPEWLDTGNRRLKVVSHRELFGDRGRLPTFNSHAIESQLHRIEGLSEHFLYLNDDVFFGRPVAPELFLHGNGLTKFFLSHAKIGLSPSAPGDMPVMSAAKNNRDLISKMFDRSVSNKFKHVPHVIRRSVMFDMERDFADHFERTAASQFRHPDDISISAALQHYYSYATGRAVPGALRYFYADIARPSTPERLQRLLERRDYDVFCLNDHDSSNVDPQEQARMMHEFLGRYFPLASAFEK